MSEWNKTEIGGTPKQWEIMTIESIKSGQKNSIAMGPFGSNIKAENFQNSGTPVIRGINMNTNRYLVGNFAYLSDEMTQKLKSSICKPNDLVFTHRGTIGQVAIIQENGYSRYIISQSGMKLTVNENIANPLFVFYFFKSKFGQYQLLKNESQVGVPSISNPLTSLKEIEILLPPLQEQQAIADVLSSLDDKIDLLHRQNKTLEQLAETLFRQWFIEEASDEWEEVKLGDSLKPKKGKNITKNQAIDGPYPVVAGGLEPSCYHTQFNTDKPVITISASGANAGFVRLYYTNIWSSDSSFIDKGVTEYVYFTYIFLKLNQRQIYDKQEGTAQPHIYPSHIMDLDALKYPQKLIDKYEKVVTPFFDKIEVNTHQFQTLTQLRDTLLPKLMSGEVRVKL